jgi:hypothetical protein
MNTILSAIDESGNEVITSLLNPLFSTLLPAFQNRAEEMTVCANLTNAGEVSVDYKKEGRKISLVPAKDFRPFITSSRIRIISSMSIVPEKHQNGKMRIRFNKEVLPVDVEIESTKDFEILRLKPLRS